MENIFMWVYEASDCGSFDMSLRRVVIDDIALDLWYRNTH